MATTETFNTLLKRYMPYEMLTEEMKLRNYFWKNVKKDQGYMGGVMDVPFEGGQNSSISYGSLTDSADVSSGTYIVGAVNSLPEIWGTMKFYEKDLERHESMEKSFLQIYPAKVGQFLDRMTERVSLGFLNGRHFAKLTATGTVGGVITVDHPERFTIGEKFELHDANSGPTNAYVKSIDMNAKTVTIVTARGGATPVDASGFTVADGAKCYLPGARVNGLTSLRDIMLPAALGGSDTLYGVQKTLYPFLQAHRHDGSTITSTNTLDKIFDAYYETVALGKANPTEILCSFKHFKNAAKSLESGRRYMAGEKTGGPGFRSLEVLGPEGTMKLTALRDMDDDAMYILDWDCLKAHGNNFFDRKRHMNGQEFFLERATSGYAYLIDVKFFGELVCSKPSGLGIIHSIA